MIQPVTPPAEEPVSLAEAKLHLRVDHDDEDTLISGLIAAARRTCEARIWRAFVTQTLDYKCDGFDPSGPMRLPIAPVASVTSISYLDEYGVSQPLSASTYRVVTGSPGAVMLAYDRTWPATMAAPDAVTIRFVAGYGAASAVPQSIKAAILLLVGHLYENREAVNIGNIVNEVPFGVDALLDAERWCVPL